LTVSASCSSSAAPANADRAVGAVDAADHLVHFAAVLLVRGHCFARRDGDLHEPDPVVQRLVLEQRFEGEQPPRDAFRVVEPIDAEQDRAPAGLGLQFGDRIVDGGRCGERAERLRVDPHREDAEAHPAILEPDAVLVRFCTRQLVHRGGEMLLIREGVESQQVGAEES
jgi:hypothetical protein